MLVEKHIAQGMQQRSFEKTMGMERFNRMEKENLMVTQDQMMASNAHAYVSRLSPARRHSPMREQMVRRYSPMREHMARRHSPMREHVVVRKSVSPIRHDSPLRPSQYANTVAY